MNPIPVCQWKWVIEKNSLLITHFGQFVKYTFSGSPFLLSRVLIGSPFHSKFGPHEFLLSPHAIWEQWATHSLLTVAARSLLTVAENILFNGKIAIGVLLCAQLSLKQGEELRTSFSLHVVPRWQSSINCKHHKLPNVSKRVIIKI